jgi:hypothetical protein
MYSPKIDSKYIPRLYRLAKEFGIAMTDLVNQKIGDALEGRSELCRNGSVSKTKYSRQRTNPPHTQSL